jgi:hypothetical protein
LLTDVAGRGRDADACLPDLGGIEALLAIRERFPDACVITLTSIECEELSLLCVKRKRARMKAVESFTSTCSKKNRAMA